MAELFISDIHGEYEAFANVLRSACGEVRRQAQACFGTRLSEAALNQLATLACYPRRKAQLLIDHPETAELGLQESLDALARLRAYIAETHGAQNASAEPAPAAPATQPAGTAASADDSPVALVARAERESAAIRALLISRVHMLGDVFDRGPSPDLIMDELMGLPALGTQLDIQWGNHDMLWMGAAAGQPGCVANVVRICARYCNLDVLTGNYGMNLDALEEFAQRVYGDDPCTGFQPKSAGNASPEEIARTARMQKAIFYIQMKAEAATIRENPSFGLDDRNLLHLINRETASVVVDGAEYAVRDMVFPTVDWADPYRMTPDEQRVLDALVAQFRGCERLQRHAAFLLERGSLYRIAGSNLLYHACIPLNADGTLRETTVFGRTLAGRTLCDAVDGYVRDAFTAENPDERKRGLDFIWWLWLAPGSPLFAKSKMATFELYLIADKAAAKEAKNAYYKLVDDPAVPARIFAEFGMDPATSRIMCGHTPVKVKDGDNPVKCGGRALIIDGGFSAAYQGTTGIAGLSVTIEDSPDANRATLWTHAPMPPIDEAIAENWQMPSTGEGLPCLS